MNKQSNPMDKYDFLIGTWHMEYTSHKGSGTGTFNGPVRICGNPAASGRLPRESAHLRTEVQR